MADDRKLFVLDTTLRDGCQGRDVNFSLEDKFAIARLLAELGVAYIEAGNPGSNPKDAAFFAQADPASLASARLTAFTATRKKGATAATDDVFQRVLASGAPVVAVFGKASAFHVQEVLRCSPEENAAMIFDSVSTLKEAGREVIFDAEHFFDGYEECPEFALQVLATAQQAGADVLCLCDTNGGTFPDRAAEIVRLVRAAFPGAMLGIHAHDDLGCAAAVTMAAVEAGCRHVQGTLAGFGERCGNANLSTVLPALQLKRGYDALGDRLSGMTLAVRELFEIANLSMPANLPFVGAGAFTHKAGMHADGVLKAARAFEQIDPALVGNRRHLVLSEISGKAVLKEKLKGTPYADSEERLERIRESLKAAELAGYAFESAEASFDIHLKKLFGEYVPSFELVGFKSISEQPGEEGAATAVVKVRVGGEPTVCAAEGDGPIHALDGALKKALCRFYRELEGVTLVDYKVRVLNPEATTAAKVRVLITSTDGRANWSTVGVSGDVVHASFLALSDSFDWYLQKIFKEKQI